MFLLPVECSKVEPIPTIPRLKVVASALGFLGPDVGRPDFRELYKPWHSRRENIINTHRTLILYSYIDYSHSQPNKLLLLLITSNRTSLIYL